MGILWTILIGFIAGVLAKLITPGDNEPSGFILTTNRFAMCCWGIPSQPKGFNRKPSSPSSRNRGLLTMVHGVEFSHRPDYSLR